MFDFVYSRCSDVILNLQFVLFSSDELVHPPHLLLLSLYAGVVLEIVFEDRFGLVLLLVQK
jgi:hypothetical protein